MRVRGTDDAESARAARRAAFAAAGVTLAYACCGVLRYRTYTNGTFDLAFYARMAWGMARGDLWDPILGAHDFGLHLCPVLLPIGLLGTLGSTPIALYLAQGLAVALAGLPLARIGARALGPRGAYAGAFALALHPNVGHVLAYEAHPGTLAVLPLAWLADAIDRRDGRTFALASLGVLACREDLALIVMLGAAVLALSARGAEHARARAAALASGLFALLWLGLFVVVLHPRYRPAAGSMEAHFGGWGRTSGEILHTLVFEPGRVLVHLCAPKRLTYLPRILGPLLLLPLLSPRALVVASPVLGVALLSFFVTTTRIDSHYLTPAIPLLVLGAFDGARVLAARSERARACLPYALGVASVLGTLGAGLFSPLRNAPAFVHPPVDRGALDRLVAHVPRDVSVEAPDALLPHFAERRVVHRPASFVHDDVAVVVDLGHRARFAHTEDLLRTSEEPRVRALFARADRRVAAVAGPYALLLRERDGGRRSVRRVMLGAAESAALAARAPSGVALASCLRLVRAGRSGSGVALDFVATAPCPSDLAIRLGEHERPPRVDLLFEGLVSPVHLRAGDVVRSVHADVRVAGVLHVGLLRSSGARPEPSDPISVAIPIGR